MTKKQYSSMNASHAKWSLTTWGCFKSAEKLNECEYSHASTDTLETKSEYYKSFQRMLYDNTLNCFLLKDMKRFTNQSVQNNDETSAH